MKFVHYTALRPPLLLPLLLLIAIEKQHGVFVFGFVPARLPLRTVQRKHPQQHRSSIRIAAGADDFFATASTATTATDQPPPQPPRAVDVEDSSTKQEPERQLRPQPPPPQRRVLGSQELLMLPRQYGPGPTVFPPMNHVSCTVLSATPDVATLRGAIVAAQHGHPLLRARVEGDGEPVRRIDMFQMVRDGHEPAPLTFVTEDCSTVFQADDVLTVVETDNVETSWKAAFARNLDDGSWCNVTKGPLWKVELHRKKSNSNYNNGNEDHSEEDQSSALLLAFNHAISDQSSVNRLTDQLLRHVAARESATTTNYNIATGTTTPIVAAPDMPVSLEDSVLGTAQRWNDVHTAGLSFDTLQYVASKVTEIWKNPVLLPDEVDRDEGVADGNSNHVMGALSIIAGRAAGGSDAETIQRRSTVQFRSLTRDVTTALVTRCRAQNVSVSNALTAAVTLTCTDFVGDRNSTSVGRKRNYKVLQSLDMRRFGAKLDQGTTVACMAGSHDLMHGPLADQSGRALRKNPSSSQLAQFWQLAADGQKQTKNFIRTNGPRHAVRVFDWAMSISDLNNLVHLTAQSKDTKGRAYSAGVTNVGVYERQLGFPQQDEQDRKPLQIQYGRYKVQDVYFATSHVTTGCLYQVSALTVDGQLKLTFNPVEPIVSAETNAQFADAFVELLETVVGDPIDTHPDDDDLNTNQSLGLASLLSVNALPAATAVLGLAAVATHSVAWAKFFTSVMEMKANVANPADFWAAMNFWIFFAVGHPILQPILWISDVLHGSPGPVIAGLVPATFLMGNLIVIAAVIVSKEIRNAVNIAALTAFFTYVGAGLDGTAGLGDFNLALDDSYKGQVVKGCPAYEDVRQPSLNDFNLEKYQGLWYEQKFHDWTQFKEMYDTTLAIRLTEGGKGWTDDFAVKGPAPDAAPLSWDKSPVANGAHYFLFGRVDPNDPKGILRESGFGVEFPNYIVDVKKDAKTGEYTEAIQFQCLERGGVRVFEGINFMSRSPTMTDAEMAMMHARAEKAGIFPYGASPEQMHTVARRPVDAPEIDNNWQAMWRAIGLDKLLEIFTEAIEDGGR